MGGTEVTGPEAPILPTDGGGTCALCLQVSWGGSLLGFLSLAGFPFAVSLSRHRAPTGCGLYSVLACGPVCSGASEQRLWGSVWGGLARPMGTQHVGPVSVAHLLNGVRLPSLASVSLALQQGGGPTLSEAPEGVLSVAWPIHMNLLQGVFCGPCPASQLLWAPPRLATSSLVLEGTEWHAGPGEARRSGAQIYLGALPRRVPAGPMGLHLGDNV